MKLKRNNGSYTTEDGKFDVYRLHGVACAKWQVRALDGSKPFYYHLNGKRHASDIYNGDTLSECKEAIEEVL